MLNNMAPKKNVFYAEVWTLFAGLLLTSYGGIQFDIFFNTKPWFTCLLPFTFIIAILIKMILQSKK